MIRNREIICLDSTRGYDMFFHVSYARSSAEADTICQALNKASALALQGLRGGRMFFFQREATPKDLT